MEKLRDGHATTLGAASGAIAGLVAITPACNVVTPLGAIAVGLVAGGACAFAVSFKYRFGYDDSLDVVGIHLVGGIIGSLIIGLLASQTATGEDGIEGLLYGGGLGQLGKQAVAVAAVFGVLLRAVLPARHAGGQDDRLPGQRGGRGHRHRRDHARRDRLRARRRRRRHRGLAGTHAARKDAEVGA